MKKLDVTRYRRGHIEQYAIHVWNMYIGRRIDKRHGALPKDSYYEIGFSGDWKIFLRFKNKPRFRNLIVLSLLLTIPAWVFGVIRGLIAVIYYLLRYAFVGWHITNMRFQTINFVMGLFWQISAIILFLILMFK